MNILAWTWWYVGGPVLGVLAVLVVAIAVIRYLLGRAEKHGGNPFI